MSGAALSWASAIAISQHTWSRRSLKNMHRRREGALVSVAPLVMEKARRYLQGSQLLTACESASAKPLAEGRHQLVSAFPRKAQE